ncbi:MAG: flagellar hook assembly protein FlgD [Bacillota bacterium]|jgi:flagellar basal-body rod modification protein FlgD
MVVSTDYDVTNINISNRNSKNNNSTLDMDDFFQLFAAQLKNQNIFDPVDNTQYMAQMAQFSTLTQMQELVNSFENLQALSLIGKNVSLSVQDATGTYINVNGLVDKVIYHEGVPFLGVGEGYYEIDSVYLVKDAEPIIPLPVEETEDGDIVADEDEETSDSTPIEEAEDSDTSTSQE